MRKLILKPIAVLCLMTAVAAYADDTEKPIPQDAAKREAKDRGALAWSQRTITEPFEKLAKKDPRWDAKAKAFIALAARKFSGPVGMDVSAEDAYKAGKEAADAGCDDPLVLYIYTRLCGGPHYPGDDEYERRMVASAAGMEKSQYPPIRRATVLIRTAALKARHKDDPAAQIEAKRLLTAGLDLLPESVKVDGTGPEAWQTWSELVFEAFGTLTK